MFSAINSLDFAFSAAIQGHMVGWLDFIFHAISFSMSPVVVVALIAWLYWRGSEKKSFYLANLLLLSALFSEGLKQVFARPRPWAQGFIDLETHSPADYSFPSGHAALAGAIVGYAKKMRFPLLALALLVALSRIYLGAHFLSDVSAGLVIGFFAGRLNSWLEKKTSHMQFKVTRIREEAILFACVALVIAIIALAHQYALAAVLIGYYAGFSLLKEMRAEQKTTGWLKQGIGFLVLTGIVGTAFASEPAKQAALFFISGLWITLIWPIMCEKLLKAKTLSIRENQGKEKKRVKKSRKNSKSRKHRR